MRYPAAEKLEIIRIVEQSHQSARKTLEATELSPRALAVRFTDTKDYFVSEATVYRLLKAHDLITSPAFIVVKAAKEFTDKTSRPNEMWQTDFTYFKIIGWGWMYLSIILDDYSRYIIAWRPKAGVAQAVFHDEGRGCHRYAGTGADRLGLRPGPCPAQTPDEANAPLI